MSFILEAPAKINWFLSVLKRRDDGYHDIVSLMQVVSLFDTLAFERSDILELKSDIPDLPPERNLVFRAAELLRTETVCRAGAKITLKKDIPLAAGLGGGSSDAATALIGLNRLWDTGLDSKRLRELASKIGSDVPFFVDSCFAIVEGRGEIITRLEGAVEAALLLVNPGIPVAASWAYCNLEVGLTKKYPDIKLFCQSLDRKDYGSLRLFHQNDLEGPVIRAYPVINSIKEMLYAQGASMAAMSGSGSTVFGVFETIEEALRASENMGTYWCRAVKTLSRSR